MEENKKEDQNIEPTLNDTESSVQEEIVEENQVDEVAQTPADLYNVAPVRTYKADIDRTVKVEKINTAKVMIAEQEKREKKEDIEVKYTIKGTTNKIKLAVSLVFIGLAIVAIIWATYSFVIPRSVDNDFIIQNAGAMFPTDKKTFIDLEGKNQQDFKNAIQEFLALDFSEPSLNEIIFYKNTIVAEETVSKRMPVASFIKAIGFDMPADLVRALSDDYMIGVFRQDGISKPFLVFKLADFSNTYSSIFGYEKKMIFDFRKYFGNFGEYELLSEAINKRNELIPEDSLINSTSTIATTTNPTSTKTPEKNITNNATTTNGFMNASTTQELLEINQEISSLEEKIKNYETFRDLVIQNTDSRAIFNSDSKMVFFYTFIDQEWLLFASDVEVLKEIKRRIREKTLSE